MDECYTSPHHHQLFTPLEQSRKIYTNDLFIKKEQVQLTWKSISKLGQIHQKVSAEFLTHIHTPACKKQKAWDSPFVSTVVGTITEKMGGTKVHFALLLGPISADPGRPKPPGFMVSHNNPCYSCPTWCEVMTYLLGPRGMKTTLSAMMSDPSDGVVEMAVPQAWNQRTWVSHFLTTSAPGWQSFLQLCHSTYIHLCNSAG